MLNLKLVKIFLVGLIVTNGTTYLLPKLFHYDINQLQLEVPFLVHGAQVGRSHACRHEHVSTDTTH